MSGSKVLIYLLRRDLRIADNPLLWHIVSGKHDYTHLLPIFVLAPHQIEVSGLLAVGEKSPYPEARSLLGKYWRCGPPRAKFLAESVWNLKGNFQEIQSNLVVRVGTFSEVLTGAFESLEGSGHPVGGVWMTEEHPVEEKNDQDAIREICQRNGAEFRMWQDEKYLIDE